MGAVMSSNDVRRIDFRDQIAYIGVIEAMMSKARDLCVRTGVAVFLVEKSRPDGISELHYKAVDRMFYGREGNHYGAAMAMIGTMKSLQVPTGTHTSDRLLKWETSQKGGLLKSVDGYTIYIAFAGDCSEDHNLEIAKLGMAMLFSDEAKG